MRIALRTSGGRGEYELAGHQSNIGASDLLGRRLTYQLTPDLVLDGLSRAEHVQGKPRIRLEEGGSHIYRVLADVFLLPLPRRELREASDRPDFIRERCFVVQDIDIDVVRDSGIEVELRPTTLWLGNAVGLVRPTFVAEHMQPLQGVWLAGEEQDPPSDLAVLVQHHTDAVTQTPPTRSGTGSASASTATGRSTSA